MRTHNIPFSIYEKKITLNYPKYNVCSYGIFFSKGLKKEFEIAVVNEPSVFEPLKFYCSLLLQCSDVSKRCRQNGKQGRPFLLNPALRIFMVYLVVSKYSRTSVARTLMAHLPRPFRTHS